MTWICNNFLLIFPFPSLFSLLLFEGALGKWGGSGGDTVTATTASCVGFIRQDWQCDRNCVCGGGGWGVLPKASVVVVCERDWVAPCRRDRKSRFQMAMPPTRGWPAELSGVPRLPAASPISAPLPLRLLCATLQISSGPPHYSSKPSRISTPVNLAPLDFFKSHTKPKGRWKLRGWWKKNNIVWVLRKKKSWFVSCYCSVFWITIYQVVGGKDLGWFMLIISRWQFFS